MKEKLAQRLPVLPIKPIQVTHEKLYTYYETDLNGEVSFRSLNLEADIEMIYNWVNQSYARRFWQLDGSARMISSMYRSILENPRAHSFIGCIDNLPACQIDVYGVVGDELQQHTKAVNEIDSGFHFLMCPPAERPRGATAYIIKNLLRWYFSFSGYERLFGEPDQENIRANKMLMDAGFRFLETIQLSSKTANLYCFTREQYFK